jgi:aminopeptidase N
MRTETGQIFKLEDYKPTPYAINHTHLTFRLAPEKTLVKSALSIERRKDTPAGAALELDGDGLLLKSVSIDGMPVAPDAVAATPDKLTLHNPPGQDHFELGIETEISPETNTALMGLYRSKGVYCTQCEAEGFRRITYYLDRPDVLSVYDVRVEARKNEAPLLLSNGNPGAYGPLGEGWHYVEWHDPFPKPSYLFALVAGDLGCLADTFTTASGREIALRIFVEHGKEERAAYAMDALKRSMRWDEERFGREYDLDVFNLVAVSDFNMGAMENKGLNVFNDKYVLANAETATDADFANIEAIVAHEYFHNWTGNRITCRDWFQLCLKEGLTVFRDHEFSADMRSRPVKRIAEVRALMAHQFPEDSGPLAHPVRPRQYREINNFYTTTVYEKGSEVVRMLQTVLGADEFRKGMDRYFDTFDGTAATIEDFLASFQAVTDKDLTQFALWYEQAGTPNVSVSRDYDSSSRQLILEFEQSIPATPGQAKKKAMHIPLAFGLVGADGHDMAFQSVSGGDVDNGVIHLKERRQKIVFGGLRERPVLSLLRGFSAPVSLDFDQRREDRLFLARHDSDSFARWQALSGLCMQEIIAATKSVRNGRAPQFDDEVLALCGLTAADDALEPALRGLAMTMPVEAEIAREIGENIDPDAVFQARKGLIKAIGAKNHAIFNDVFSAMRIDGPFSPDADSAGQRALANILLHYLSVHESKPDRARTAYGGATNMTDRAAALSILVHEFPEDPAAEEALGDFEKRFAADPVVLDKWFSLQATIPGAETLETVRKLSEHKAYSIRNPNRFRALVGAFASGNHTGFNRADGEGYKFVADQILEVETFNPQVAARLATIFRSFRGLEEGRREKARQALVFISEHKSLSADLSDIVDRLLS